MAYRAPELYDVKTDTTLDEKVDIWVRAPLLLLISIPESCLVSRLHSVRDGLLAFSV